MKSVPKEKQKSRTKRAGRLPLLIVLLLFAGWFACGVQSAYGITAYIDAQPGKAEVGQDVSVTVVFSGDDVGRVRATLEYDTAILSYQGEEGDSGMVSLYMAGVGEDISYDLPFKAVGAGESQLVLTPLNAYDLDERSIDLPETQAVTVSVAADPSADPDKKEEVGPAPSDPGQDQDKDQDDKESGDKDKNKDKDKTPEKTGSNATVFILLALAAVLVLVLAIVLILRRKRRE